MPVQEAPLYPMSVYIYDADGNYGFPVRIMSEAQLTGPGTKLMLQVAMRQKVEIRITDPGDMLLFHANKGKILFDGVKVYEQ